MSVRKRKGTSNWVVDFRDADGKRRLRTFKTKGEADRFRDLAAAVRSGVVPEPMTAKWFRPIEFTAPLPNGSWRYGDGRLALTAALRSACPMLQPTTDSVILHLIAELPPRSTVADVDNLLKPVLDALTGTAWVDDVQICEMLVRRVAGRERRLKIRLWRLPHGAVAPHLNALMKAGFIQDW
jgi:hypothetical protein